MGTVAITGANRGLGLALAQTYRAAGHAVIGGCRTPSAARELRASGAEVLELDMADLASVSSFATQLDGRPIDVLYNSAGVDTRAFGATDETRGALTISPDNFESVMRVNVTGPLALVQALSGSLGSARGKVVNISSQIGSMEVAQTIGRDVAYAVSKAAMNMMTLKQAQALANDGVTVIAMHPGWLRTDMGGAGADLETSDAAYQIVETVGALTIVETGRFFRWDGSIHPW
jgi:NAD(P)-dependent dehydrogenase (short-subunit alcohol dehydrogenase family)